MKTFLVNTVLALAASSGISDMVVSGKGLPEKNIRLEVFIDESAALKQLGNSNDSLFLEAIRCTEKLRETNPDSSIVKLFSICWSELSGGKSLASAFNSYRLKDFISPDSDDSKVLFELDREIYETCFAAAKAIESRLDGFGVFSQEMTRIGPGRYDLKVRTDGSQESIKQLLTKPGVAEILATYKASEIVPFISEIDFKELSSQNLLGDFLSNLDEPYLTSVSPADTAKVSAFFRTPDVYRHLPTDLKLRWGKARGDNNVVWLYLLKKTTIDDRGVIDGRDFDKVKAARSTTDEYYQINIDMTPRAAQKWARVTADNIGRNLAILIDNEVCLAPKVMLEITGGKASIAGAFTEEEARGLTAILNSPLPLRVNIKTLSVSDL